MTFLKNVVPNMQSGNARTGRNPVKNIATINQLGKLSGDKGKNKDTGVSITGIRRDQEESIRNCMKIYQRIYRNEDDFKIWINRWAENVRIIAEYRKNTILDIGKQYFQNDHNNYLKASKSKLDYEKSLKFGLNENLKIIESRLLGQAVEKYPTLLIQPGNDLQKIVPFCTPVVIHKKES